MIDGNFNGEHFNGENILLKNVEKLVERVQSNKLVETSLFD